MVNFWWNVLAAAVGQAIAFLLFKGFVSSYWGRNCTQEITRWFDKMSKHMRKTKC